MPIIIGGQFPSVECGRTVGRCVGPSRARQDRPHKCIEAEASHALHRSAMLRRCADTLGVVNLTTTTSGDTGAVVDALIAPSHFFFGLLFLDLVTAGIESF